MNQAAGFAIRIQQLYCKKVMHFFKLSQYLNFVSTILDLESAPIRILKFCLFSVLSLTSFLVNYNLFCYEK